MTFRGQNALGNVDRIQRAVCDCMELPKGSMRAATRRASVSHPRMLAMYLCRTRLKLSFAAIGEAFGGRDHTTVMSAVERIGAMLQSRDPSLLAAMEKIEGQLDEAPPGPRPDSMEPMPNKIVPIRKTRCATCADAADLTIADAPNVIEALRIKILLSPIGEGGLCPEAEQDFLLALTMLEVAQRHAAMALLRQRKEDHK